MKSKALQVNARNIPAKIQLMSSTQLKPVSGLAKSNTRIPSFENLIKHLLHVGYFVVFKHNLLTQDQEKTVKLLISKTTPSFLICEKLFV